TDGKDLTCPVAPIFIVGTPPINPPVSKQKESFHVHAYVPSCTRSAAYRAHLRHVRSVKDCCTSQHNGLHPVRRCAICAGRFRDRGDRGGGRRARSAAWFSIPPCGHDAGNLHTRDRRVVPQQHGGSESDDSFPEEHRDHWWPSAGRRFWRRRIQPG